MARWLIGSFIVAGVLVTARPLCFAQENKASLDAASVIWRYFFEIDATLATCLRVDASNARSYVQVRGIFTSRVYHLLANITGLVHLAEKRGHHQGKEFMEAAQEQREMVKDEIEQTAAANPERFQSHCRALPPAVVAESDPFQPIDKKFSAEYKSIQKWTAQMNVLSSDRSKTRLSRATTTPKDKVTCEAQGGKWGPLGGFRNQTGCNIPYSDGGTTCSDSSECQGRCIFEDQIENFVTSKAVKEFKPGEPVTGVCAPWRTMFGCFTYVRKGKVIPGPCID